MIVMKAHTILCVTEDQAEIQRLQDSLGALDCEIVAVPPSQAVAFLFIYRVVEAVILDDRDNGHSVLEFARIMKSLRKDVRIVLISTRNLDPLPSFIDECLLLSGPIHSAARRVCCDHSAAA